MTFQDEQDKKMLGYFLEGNEITYSQLSDITSENFGSGFYVYLEDMSKRGLIQITPDVPSDFTLTMNIYQITRLGEIRYNDLLKQIETEKNQDKVSKHTLLFAKLGVVIGIIAVLITIWLSFIVPWLASKHV